MTDDARERLLDLIAAMSDDEVQNLMQELESDDHPDGKRRHPRVSYEASVLFADFRTAGKGTLVDVSISGLFLHVDPSQFSVGQKLSLSIPYPNVLKQILIRGKIVRATHDGVAVEFEREI